MSLECAQIMQCSQEFVKALAVARPRYEARVFATRPR